MTNAGPPAAHPDRPDGPQVTPRWTSAVRLGAGERLRVFGLVRVGVRLGVRVGVVAVVRVRGRPAGGLNAGAVDSGPGRGELLVEAGVSLAVGEVDRNA